MKNIRVIDLQGYSYEATYPKRAKGLVKKGRARFVNENTICLLCPPHTDLEELVMATPSLNENIVELKTSAPIMDLTAAQIFEALTKIREDTSHIDLAMEKLEKVPTDCSDTEVCKEKITAIMKIAEEREKTNQALIQLYEKMYDDAYYEAHGEVDTEENVD